jgi:glucose-6-phosphate isomerase
MHTIHFSATHSGISGTSLRALQAQLQPALTTITQAWNSGYTTEYASLSLPFDTHLHEVVAALVHAKKKYEPAALVVIGIGGSSLGVEAVYQALDGSMTLPLDGIPLWIVDGIDPCATHQRYTAVEQLLQKGERIILIISSKSGTTTETIAQAQLFTSLLARYCSHYKDYMIIISDEASPLYQVAQKASIAHVAIPVHVGGRFSLLSAVGLVPLALAGIDIVQLVRGAAAVRVFTHAWEDNAAALSAALLYAHYQAGRHIHDSFFFVARLEGIGRWYRQLLSESIGKSHTQDGKRINVGITPTVSIGSMDLHSMVQLYLAGPDERVTTFISVQENSEHIVVPAGTLFEGLVPMIVHKSYHEIMEAILTGVQSAYRAQQRPSMTMTLPTLSAYWIGHYMQLKMVEIMYLGALFAINPFDQPAVELYKKETRKILAHE